MAVVEAARRLLDELAEDPHEKGVEDAQDWCPNLRILQIGPVKAFFAVRSLDDRYVEVLGFSTA